MINGIKMTLGGVERVLAPLNFRALRSVGPRLGLLSKINPAEGVSTEVQDLIIEIVMSSLQRNYPDMTQDQVADVLDLGNFTEVILAILRGSNLKGREVPGEAAGP